MGVHKLYRSGTSALAHLLVREPGKETSRLLRLGSKADVNSTLEN